MFLGEYKSTRLKTFVSWLYMVVHFARTSYPAIPKTLPWF